MRPKLRPHLCLPLIIPVVLALTAFAADGPWMPIFDGETLAGWEGDANVFRVQDSAIVAGTLARPLPRNEFLCTTAEYDDFVLRLQFKLVGEGANAGVQFRSQRVPGSNEVSGYQADLGEGWWGGLYDEARRNRLLVAADIGALAPVLDETGWNQYDVYANGRRIRLFINGHLTVDYTEPERDIPQDGRICLQMHSGPGEAWYKDVQIKDLERKPEATIGARSEAVRFRKHVLTSRFLSEGAAVADVDRDGDQDVIAGAYWFEAPSWKAHELYPSKEYPIHIYYSDTFLSYLIDFDGDGWTDVVSFDFPGKALYAYRNPGTKERHWEKSTVLPAANGESPRFEDVNGDGRRDLVFIDGANRQLVWLEPPARGGTTWRCHAISEPLPDERGGPFTHGLGIGDVNGDGRADIFTRDAWWESLSADGTRWKEHRAPLGEPAAHMYALDVDGDGDRDVVSSSAHDYGLWWHEQGGGGADGSAWTTHTIDDRVSQTHALALADLDGDGLQDLVTGKRFFAHNGHDPGEFEPAVLLWYAAARNPDDEPTWTPYLIDEEAGVGLQLVVEDVTGDGRADILTAGKKGVFLFERLSEDEAVQSAR